MPELLKPFSQPVPRAANDGGGWRPRRSLRQLALRALPNPRSNLLEFHPGAIEIVNSPPSPLGRSVAWSVMLAVTIMFVWAFLGSVDIVIIGRGRIVPSAHATLIQAPEGAQVSAIHVRNGQQVAPGAPLVDLNPIEAAADHTQLQRELTDLRLRALRLRVLMAFPGSTAAADALFSPPPDLAADMVALHRNHLLTGLEHHFTREASFVAALRQERASAASAEADLKRLTATLPLLEEQVETRRDLVARGISPRLEFLNQERQLLDTRLSVPILQARLEQASAASSRLNEESRQYQLEYRQTHLRDLSETEERMAAIQQQLVKAEHRMSRLQLTAPTAGTVQELVVHSEGAVVSPAQTLLTIVPTKSGLEVEAQIQSRDIGWIRVGQPVSVKIDAFDFTKYGMLEGRVKSITSDAVSIADPRRTPMNEQPVDIYFGVTITLEDEVLATRVAGNLPLSAGMTVNAEIIGGRRRIMDYILSPVLEHAQESLRER